MKRKVIILLIIVIISIVGINFYISQLFGKMNTVNIPEKDIHLGINEEIIDKEEPRKEEESPQKEKIEITNIALFGIDRSNPSEIGRSDAIIIASLDTVHKKIKLTSIMRDTYVDIPDRGMDKINHAYAFGGAELSLRTINQNFSMNIRDFVTVDFNGLEGIIDSLGGINLDIKNYEVSHVPGSFIGEQTLNGEQTLAYTRIRKSGKGDYERTERQRLVLEKIIEKGLTAGVMKYPKILNAVLPYVDTSLSKNKILKLGINSFGSGIKGVEQFRIPTDEHSSGQMINKVYYLVPKTLEDNVDLLHQFIYEN